MSLEEQRRSSNYEFKSQTGFPTTVEDLQLFVDTHSILHEHVNDFAYQLTTQQQNCPLMEKWKNRHAKSYDREGWKMIVYIEKDTSLYQIAIINIKEQIFAKTFSLLFIGEVENALNLNGYEIVFSIYDYEIMTHHRKALPLLLSIHSCHRMGNCQLFRTDIQKNTTGQRSYLQPCPYCDVMNNPMASSKNSGIYQFLLKERRRSENIKSIASHVLPENRRSILCLASLLGLNVALTNVLLLREKHDHRSFMMNIFDKRGLERYFETLQSRHMTLLDTTSEEYLVSWQQLMVAKRG